MIVKYSEKLREDEVPGIIRSLVITPVWQFKRMLSGPILKQIHLHFVFLQRDTHIGDLIITQSPVFMSYPLKLSTKV